MCGEHLANHSPLALNRLIFQNIIQIGKIIKAIMLQNIYFSNICCSFEFSIHQ